MSTRSTRAVQGLGAGLVIVGGLTVVSRERLVEHLGASRALPWALAALTARQVVQGAALVARPRADALTVAAAVDLLHAASLLPLLAVPSWRRFALWSGSVALGFAMAEGSLLRTVD